MDGLESAFLADAQKLNKKRQEQILKRVKRVIPDLISAQELNNSIEVYGILSSLKMPSSKEWGKLINRLVVSSAKEGVLRAHFELLRLKKLYEFSDDYKVVSEGYDYDVIFPKEAREFLDKYSYEIGVITEETVLERIREELRRGLEEGISNQELYDSIMVTAQTWLSPSHAQTIARTEIGKMYNAGRLARYTDPETNGFVEALQYDAIVDSRTTELCTHLDGRIIAITNSEAVAEYTPPNHYQCRATWLPVTKYEEWEDNWDSELKPADNFVFTAPSYTHKLLEGKKEPLVQPIKKVDPSTITDPEAIRSLSDDDFKVAIGNVTDQKVKLAMVKERAEIMAVNDGVIQKVTSDIDFSDLGEEDGQYRWVMFDEVWSAPLPPRGKTATRELMKSLGDSSLSNNEKLKLIDDFIEKNAKKPTFMGIVAELRTARKQVTEVIQFGELVPTKRSAEVAKYFNVKKPPMTENYRNAEGLRRALDSGQAWMDKYLDDKLAPQKTGLQLKFQHDLTRAYATGAHGTIHFGANESNAGVIVHESAHVMHWNNMAVADLTHQFFIERTKNRRIDKKVWNSRDGKGNITTEWAYPDDFIHYYTGREYGWETKNREAYKIHGYASNGFLGQEVVSMGMQQMYENYMSFYKKDKDHFLFIYGLMKGLF